MTRHGIVRGSGPWKLLREEFVEATERERGIDPDGVARDAEAMGREPDGGDMEVGDGEEGREARSQIPPPAPSERDRRLHRVTHFPFRSWCSECAAGR